jgi:multicomponent Na+:H+ antiporter subunit F
MTSSVILLHATTIAIALLIVAMLLSVVRLLRGPTLPDRILALDTMNTLGIGLIGVFAIRTGVTLYLDVAIALGLVGFLSTVALARYVLHRAGRTAHES